MSGVEQLRNQWNKLWADLVEVDDFEPLDDLARAYFLGALTALLIVRKHPAELAALLDEVAGELREQGVKVPEEL